MALVVSHIHSRFDALLAQAERQAALADLIELRLDRIGHPGRDALRAAAKRFAKPLIAACPGPEAFGHFAGSAAQRIELLHDAAKAGFGFVDLDARLALDFGPAEGKCHRIVSRHIPEHTPTHLAAELEQLRAVMGEGDILKLVSHARSCEDGLRMLNFVRAQKGLIGFCSGAAGSFTRVLAPVFGSPFTYAAPPAMPGQPEPERTAPGQIRANDLHALLPPGGVNQDTAVLAVVGKPVAHSWSPRVHGMALKHARLDAVYVALEPDSLAGLLAQATDACFRGFSVTAPFKQQAFELATARDPNCLRVRAANTLLREHGGWRASNTDVTAVAETLERAFQAHAARAGVALAPAAASVLVLGAGGAARAAIEAARGMVASVHVAARRAEAARALAAELGVRALDWAQIEGFPCDALVHCTPAGSLAQPDVLPIPREWLRPHTLVLDAVYRPIKTPLLMAALERGCTPVPGGEWFVRQAREQFRLFTQSEPDDAVLRGAFEHALASEASAPRGSSAG